MESSQKHTKSTPPSAQNGNAFITETQAADRELEIARTVMAMMKDCQRLWVMEAKGEFPMPKVVMVRNGTSNGILFLMSITDRDLGIVKKENGEFNYTIDGEEI